MISNADLNSKLECLSIQYDDKVACDRASILTGTKILERPLAHAIRTSSLRPIIGLYHTLCRAVVGHMTDTKESEVTHTKSKTFVFSTYTRRERERLKSPTTQGLMQAGQTKLLSL